MFPTTWPVERLDDLLLDQPVLFAASLERFERSYVGSLRIGCLANNFLVAPFAIALAPFVQKSCAARCNDIRFRPVRKTALRDWLHPLACESNGAYAERVFGPPVATSA